MTRNEKEVARIMAMSIEELLGYVIESPEYLIDSYFSVFGHAIEARAAELGAIYDDD